jgi:hypothetical protein
MLVLIVATACAGLFAGAAIYITAVEHPARSLVDQSVDQFQPESDWPFISRDCHDSTLRLGFSSTAS